MVNEIPYLTFYQLDTTEISDPSGERHIVGGSFAFEKVVSSGICVSGLNFPNLTFDLSDPSDSYASVPIALIFRLDNISNGSGINKFRFYLSDDSALRGGAGIKPYGFVQMAISGIWQPNCVLPSGIGTQMIQGYIPANANVFRQDSKVFIDGIGDLDVSQYIYLNVVLPSFYSVGDFGVCGSGNLRFSLLYNYSAIP